MANNNKMTSEQFESEPDQTHPNMSFVMRNWPTILILSVIAFYLIAEHQAHLLGALPWLILLACPFIHIFMHHGHGHSQHNYKEMKDE